MILFRQIRYFDKRSQKVWKERAALHVFLKDGEDSIGTRWKSACGLFHHGHIAGQIPIEDLIETFIGYHSSCKKCKKWFLEHKEEILVSLKMGG